MPCLELPPFPSLPKLLAGLSIPIFPGLTLPSIGLCCKIQVPPWGKLPVPAVTLQIAFPAAAIAAYATFVAALQEYYDAVGIPCPNE